MIPELADSRALGMKDEPFSAYCRVCWQRVYALWIDAVPHGGVCPFGATKIQDCDQAMDWERVTGEIRSYLAEAHQDFAQRVGAPPHFPTLVEEDKGE